MEMEYITKEEEERLKDLALKHFIIPHTLEEHEEFRDLLRKYQYKVASKKE